MTTMTTTTTNVFAVVGQATADPGRLLLLGEDGRFYAYAADGRLRSADLGAGWRLDDGGTSGQSRDPGDPKINQQVGSGSRSREQTSR